MSAPTPFSEGGYSQYREQVLTSAKKLRAVGAHIHLDLPRIVVIGNQSAGKSSLIEAISGIEVPRNAGTCTRCPMECRLLSSKEEWSCQVSIRWEFDADGRSKDHVEQVPFGGLLTDKSDVELMLRRAQTAVLDSGKRPLAYYANMNAGDLYALPWDLSTLPFSQNVVCVDISGPDLTYLSFVDLPGIISNADANVVKFVERMVQSYISGTCLIVVALSMETDIENQTALRLAREADHDDSRTVGVMTKADRWPVRCMEAREIELWLEILEGRSQDHHLRHGYYCTRQPNAAERAAGITPSEAREAETLFFQTTAPWDTSANKQHLGTENLVRHLSNMLAEMIRV
ncbi:P-loop containing nucleoside triphosphate hydrolase protein [Fomitopsis serialis]|uniref:P-loop containing nucleoside triphosphate hydrolase protein n=1 Tax=Fomitopsis serialis TaxID=139415 RepID=UPI0020074091|nr:P-loop containing nucleoside triphosphate hydrolase protein [Neoantrodia serialis]KAH9909437.1 P-loop containing nucleoside triphosphate hydrolase protein [Neoantrodia serialis]